MGTPPAIGSGPWGTVRRPAELAMPLPGRRSYNDRVPVAALLRRTRTGVRLCRQPISCPICPGRCCSRPSCATRAPAMCWWSTPTPCGAHVEQVVRTAGRDDLVVRQVEPPPPGYARRLRPRMPLTELSTSGRMQIPGGPRRRPSGWLHRLVTWLRTLTNRRGAAERWPPPGTLEPTRWRPRPNPPPLRWQPAGRRSPRRSGRQRVLRVPMLESPNRSPLILAAAQPPPLMNVRGAGTAKRRHDVMPPPAPAVYREPGGVPTPPNLRPFSRAGTAPCKGLPQAARAARP